MLGPFRNSVTLTDSFASTSIVCVNLPFALMTDMALVITAVCFLLLGPEFSFFRENSYILKPCGALTAQHSDQKSVFNVSDSEWERSKETIACFIIL